MKQQEKTFLKGEEACLAAGRVRMKESESSLATQIMTFLKVNVLKTFLADTDFMMQEHPGNSTRQSKN